MLLRVVYSVIFTISLCAVFLPSQAQSNNGPNPEKIPDSIVSISSGYVVTVDKKFQKLYVFKKNGNFSKVFETNCSTGKNQGGKQVSGDAKTPHGIFFATKILSNPGPPETYGTLAFPLDYPTITDKRAGRNGTNIWIHGTIKPLMPFQSNGCVVLSDKDIHVLSKFIQINKTPVIITETISWIPQNKISSVKTELENILSLWTKSYIDGDIKAMDALYFEDHRIKGKKRESLVSKMTVIKNINQHFMLEPKDISILQQNHSAVILFDQITDINRDNSFEGSFNKLSLEKANNKWLIIDDVETSTTAQKSDKLSSPGQDTELVPREAVRNVIVKWTESWKSGNMANYRSCYTSDFRSQGMNLKEWVNHKIAVRNRSKNININIENLEITGDKNRSTATFTQHYSSNLLKSKGNKKLELKKINNKWKIYRETMQ
ncbi:MAG: L,D-transpeptidase [Deltaproteobacteria bacterium]